MADRPVTSSGDGTRPSTDGGVDNMGAGESFTGRKSAAGEDVSGPGPTERMQGKRRDVQGTKEDDSAAFDLREDLTPETNQEPAQSAEATATDASREEEIRRAAYERYQRRGSVEGNETQDWFEADAEVNGRAAPGNPEGKSA